MAAAPTKPAASTKPDEKPQLSEKHLAALKKRTHLKEEDIRATFEDFHATAKSGQLTEEEFLKLWSETSPQVEDASSISVGKRVFAFFDRDHSGKVDFSEFMLGSTLMMPGTPTQKLALLFIVCDFNHDGFLSRSEIENMFLLTHKTTDDTIGQDDLTKFKAHLDTVFDKFDVNKDGKISQKEFTNLCNNDEVFKKLLA